MIKKKEMTGSRVFSCPPLRKRLFESRAKSPVAVVGSSFAALHLRGEKERERDLIYQ